MASNQQSIPQDIIQCLEDLNEEKKLSLAKDLNRLRNGRELEKFENCFLNDFFNLKNGKYTIQLIGGMNSANFLIKNKDTQESWILQLENKLQKNTNIAEKKLVAKKQYYKRAGKQNEMDFLVSKYYSSGVIEYGGGMFKEIHIVKHIKGHNLSEFFSLTCDKETNEKSEIAYDKHLIKVVNHYKKAAEILVKLEKEGICFPDLKGSNLLVNSEGKVVISDVKSMIPTRITADGHIMVSANFLTEMEIDPSLIGITPYMVPPELKNGRVQETFDVKKLHAFLLGMSLYIDLTGIDLEKVKQDAKSHNGFQPDYTHKVFSTLEGRHYKRVLEGLIHQDPCKRIDVEEFLILSGKIANSKFKVVESKPLEDDSEMLLDNQESSPPKSLDDNRPVSRQSIGNANRFRFFDSSQTLVKRSNKKEISDGDSYYSNYGNTPTF